MRRLIIEFGDGATGRCGFDVIDEYGRIADGLSWDEFLGQIVSMTHPGLGRPQFRMQTPEQWQAERDERRQRMEARREAEAAVKDMPF